MTWSPNSNTRIRYESHPGDSGPFNARHHGEHYHVETKPSDLSWGQANRRGLIQKINVERKIIIVVSTKLAVVGI
jgi:hypothetical protein